MGFAIDHVVILVDHLAAAMADYAALGFTVVEGGAHATGMSHNALIALADGSYLELIAFTDPAARTSPKLSAIDRRFLRRGEGGEGLVGWALLPTDIAADLDAARGRGLALAGPTPGGRTRPDGAQVRWQTGVPETLDLPFLCADVTPRNIRVPDGPARVHRTA
ncbi:MAG: VOC family protein [Anaerolineae bacterium]|nr:VOC family protein [Anaerolineae bacterium]